MKIRVRFAKLGKVRFTSHRDVARMWERALRRAELPVARTEGFHPRPKVSFGLALSTGHESLAEYLDVDVAGSLGDDELSVLPQRLSAELPTGVDVLVVAELATQSRSLQEAVGSCTWEIDALGHDLAVIETLVERALASEELVITRTRKGREVVDDLRRAMVAVSVLGEVPGGARLTAELAVHPRSVRPSELLTALDDTLEEGRVLRTAQWIWNEDAREEPLPLGPDVGLYVGSTLATPADGRDTRRDDDHDRTRSRDAGVAVALKR